MASLKPDYDGVVVTDIRMPRVDGHSVLNSILARDPELPVILMTGQGDIAMAVSALKQGAFDFIAKPFATDHMMAAIHRALETRRLGLESRRLRKMATRAEENLPLLGETPAMVRLRETIRQLASVNVDVLVEGETGTGKELVARLLHRWSTRRARNFVAIDCAALPDAIAADTLFGDRFQRGRIMEADRGTLFLDEIDSMSPALQGKLLRVVEERELPTTSGEPRAVDLRIVAAAKDHLTGAVESGRFRADLLYRLDAVRIRIPPLRERRADIGLLFSHFVGEAARQFGRTRPAFTAAIEARLISDDWSGNVRELRNFAMQVTLGLGPSGNVEHQQPSLSEQMDRFEIGVIEAALRRARGDVGDAAEALDLPRRSLYARLQRYGIDGADFRNRSSTAKGNRRDFT
ncbi:sigma-54-dependent transcriptional regulator [Agrobacterium sp. NPDC089420]|uniref:sigma-54-dependent transcriptional regulator n=1 Tax=Agrobacterium sp. NPDC089420 TaxID=3363918 RepID=UPI00385078B7